MLDDKKFFIETGQVQFQLRFQQIQ